MDRIVTAKFQADRATDILNVERNMMVALGSLVSAVIGTGECVSGLAASSISGSLAIQIGPGAIFMPSSVDQAAFGALPADSSTLMKCGVNLGSFILNMPTPPPSGDAVNVLVEASLVEYDTTVPATPNYAASGDAIASNTVSPSTVYGLRRQALVLRALPGMPATTGSQVTPSAQTGWVPLYTVTITSTDTSVQPGSITLFPGAPFVASTLPQVASAVATSYNVAGLAPVASPQLTGAPTAPTPQNGDNSNRIATTAFVLNNMGFSTGPWATINSPIFQGMPTAPTPPNSDDSNRIATTAFVVASMTGGIGTNGFATILNPQFTGNPTAPTPALTDSSGSIATTAYVQRNLANYALLSGAAFTSTPTAPTAAATDNSTHLATTAYVKNAISLATATLATTVSPSFTGTPTAVTQSVTDNSTRLATTAFVQKAVSNAARLRLATNTTIQVSTTGSDVTGSLSTSFASITGAWDWAQTMLDLNGYTLTIQIGSGTYTSGELLEGRMVGQTGTAIYITGNTANPSSVILASTANIALEAAFGANIILQGMTLSSPTPANSTLRSGTCLAADYAAAITFNHLAFGVAGNAHIEAVRGSLIVSVNSATGTASSYSITGNAPVHWYATGGGEVSVIGTTISMATGLTFTYFAVSEFGSYLSAFGDVFVGPSVSGTKFIVSTSGSINTNGSGVGYFPGTVAGSVGTNANYV